jgi:hypothetical protein
VFIDSNRIMAEEYCGDIVKERTIFGTEAPSFCVDFLFRAHVSHSNITLIELPE